MWALYKSVDVLDFRYCTVDVTEYTIITWVRLVQDLMLVFTKTGLTIPTQGHCVHGLAISMAFATVPVFPVSTCVIW